MIATVRQRSRQLVCHLLRYKLPGRTFDYSISRYKAYRRCFHDESTGDAFKAFLCKGLSDASMNTAVDHLADNSVRSNCIT
jgi:hypothetical protein